MKRYVIRTVSTATEDNPNFAGEVHTWWYGKGDTYLAFKVKNAKAWHNEFNYLDEQNIAEYGYARKCDAVRSYAYKHPENTRFWTTRAEIIEFEV